jgi:hypothetical protein
MKGKMTISLSGKTGSDSGSFTCSSVCSICISSVSIIGGIDVIYGLRSSQLFNNQGCHVVNNKSKVSHLPLDGWVIL